MKLLIDNREPNNIIKYLEAINKEGGDKITIEIKSLEIGDYIFYNEKTIMFFGDAKNSIDSLTKSFKELV